MKSFLTLSAVSFLFIGITASCSLEDRINGLDERISAIEEQIQAIKSDMASIQDIVNKLQSSVTIDNIVENENGYTINFSDNTSVTITNGGDGVTPPSITVMEIDGQYYWGLKYSDGSVEPITDSEGNNIHVTGGIPDIRINPETGNWEISTDGGEHWNDTGMPSAGEGDSIFNQVTQDENNVYFELRGGTIITVPKTKEVIFEFGTNEDTLTFSYGESKTLENYRLSGADKVSITKPDGWRASIEPTGFIITAPVAENKFAETEGVICVILVSSNGQSFMAEQKVSVEDGFASGNGSATDPYIIDNTSQLTLFSERVNSGDSTYISAHYMLNNDIDLSGIDWQPIGAGIGNTDLTLAENNCFEGSFNGNGHKITGLSIKATVTDDISFYGLFGLCRNSTISNLNVEGDIEISDTPESQTGMVAAGGIIGSGSGVTVSNCSFSGSIKASCPNSPNASIAVGGIVGNLIGSMEGCSVTVPEGGSISSSASFSTSGAVAGYVNSGTITSCNADIYGIISSECPETAVNALSPTAIAGGLIGSSFGGSIGNCRILISGDIIALCEHADTDDIGSALAGGISGSYAADAFGNNNVEISGNITARGVNSASAGGAVGSQNNAGYGASQLDVNLSGNISSETFGNGLSDAAYSGGIYGRASFQMGDISDSYAVISGSISAKSTVFAGTGGVAGTSSTVTRSWAICSESGMLSAESDNNDAVTGGVSGIITSGNIVGCYSILDGEMRAVSSNGGGYIGGIAGAMSGNMMRAKYAISCYSLSDCTVSLSGTPAMTGAIVGLNNRYGTLNTCYWHSGNDSFTGHSGAEGASDLYKLADRSQASLEEAAAAMNEILTGYSSQYTYDNSTGWLIVYRIE